ncbi:MAG: hypothetical protein NWR72_10230, partial [Bacteroidia bacterium]|nr:hypothetical protein [Bacteroidia bacterium]
LAEIGEPKLVGVENLMHDGSNYKTILILGLCPALPVGFFSKSQCPGCGYINGRFLVRQVMSQSDFLG